MKNNYTTFIAHIELKDYCGDLISWTGVVYKTDCNKLFIETENRNRKELMRISSKSIKHIYG